MLHDGSKMEDGRTGLGAYIKLPNGKSHTISEFTGRLTTVFQAELRAVETAAIEIIHTNPSDGDVFILVDSQAALKALASNPHVSKTVIATHTALNRLAERRQVFLNWIPGHAGVEGNEIADRAAKAGATYKVAGPEPFTPVPSSIFREATKVAFLTEQEKRFRAELRFRQTKSTLVKMNKNLKNKFLSLGRWKLREVIQMITGHGMLRRHRFISNKTDNPLCEKCSMGAEEYPDHFVGTCPAFQQIRQEIFGKATTTLKSIIAAENIKLLSRYIQRTERLKEPFD